MKDICVSSICGTGGLEPGLCGRLQSGSQPVHWAAPGAKGRAKTEENRGMLMNPGGRWLWDKPLRAGQQSWTVSFLFGLFLQVVVRRKWFKALINRRDRAALVRREVEMACTVWNGIIKPEQNLCVSQQTVSGKDFERWNQISLVIWHVCHFNNTSGFQMGTSMVNYEGRRHVVWCGACRGVATLYAELLSEW